MQNKQRFKGIADAGDAALMVDAVAPSASFCGDNGCSVRCSFDEWCGLEGRRETGSLSVMLVSLIPLTTFENSASASGSIDSADGSATSSAGAVFIGSPKEIVELITDAMSSSTAGFPSLASTAERSRCFWLPR